MNGKCPCVNCVGVSPFIVVVLGDDRLTWDKRKIRKKLYTKAIFLSEQDLQHFQAIKKYTNLKISQHYLEQLPNSHFSKLRYNHNAKNPNQLRSMSLNATVYQATMGFVKNFLYIEVFISGHRFSTYDEAEEFAQETCELRFSGNHSLLLHHTKALIEPKKTDIETLIDPDWNEQTPHPTSLEAVQKALKETPKGCKFIDTTPKNLQVVDWSFKQMAQSLKIKKGEECVIGECITYTISRFKSEQGIWKNNHLQHPQHTLKP
jgi:hypothetical protein